MSVLLQVLMLHITRSVCLKSKGSTRTSRISTVHSRALIRRELFKRPGRGTSDIPTLWKTASMPAYIASIP